MLFWGVKESLIRSKSYMVYSDVEGAESPQQYYITADDVEKWTMISPAQRKKKKSFLHPVTQLLKS